MIAHLLRWNFLERDRPALAPGERLPTYRYRLRGERVLATLAKEGADLLPPPPPGGTTH